MALTNIESINFELVKLESKLSIKKIILNGKHINWKNMESIKCILKLFGIFYNSNTTGNKNIFSME